MQLVLKAVLALCMVSVLSVLLFSKDSRRTNDHILHVWASKGNIEERPPFEFLQNSSSPGNISNLLPHEYQIEKVLGDSNVRRRETEERCSIQQDNIRSMIQIDESCASQGKYQFVFIHVPKAGGTSFEAMYQQDSNKFAQVNPGKEKVGRNIKAQITPLHHNFDGLAKYHSCNTDLGQKHLSCTKPAGECVVWMTVLRDPVERFISDFYHTNGRRENNHHFSCDRGVSPKLANENDINKFMDADLSLLLKKCSKDFQKTFSMLTSVDGRRATEEHIAAAKTRINQMHFVGIMEEMDKTMQLFSYTFRLDLVRYFPAFNYNAYSKGRATEATRQKIERLSPVDRELYAHARGVFRERYARMERELREGQCAAPASFACSGGSGGGGEPRCWAVGRGNRVLAPHPPFRPVPMGEVAGILRKNGNARRPYAIFCSPPGGCVRNATTVPLP